MAAAGLLFPVCSLCQLVKPCQLRPALITPLCSPCNEHGISRSYGSCEAESATPTWAQGSKTSQLQGSG